MKVIPIALFNYDKEEIKGSSRWLVLNPLASRFWSAIFEMGVPVSSGNGGETDLSLYS